MKSITFYSCEQLTRVQIDFNPLRTDVTYVTFDPYAECVPSITKHSKCL